MLCLVLLLVCIVAQCLVAQIVSAFSLEARPVVPSRIPGIAKLSAVILTTGKDTRVFEKSIHSALLHLLDVDTFYIITPNLGELQTKFENRLGPRVVFVDEGMFPFKGDNVSDVMIDSVKQKGVYPLEEGKSQFERTIWGRIGWFLQQLLKMYAGRVLHLQDYVLLDSDLVWNRDVYFISDEQHSSSASNVTRYYYATSTQYHPSYVSTVKKIAGVDMYNSKKERFRSGICHHMVLVKPVLDALFETAEALHGGLPFWQIMLNQSSLEMTCRAPRAGICGAGSTLSEYELYFNFARVKFPDTVQLRPLLWANGPMPGLLFWPDATGLDSDGAKGNWLSHRQNEVMNVLEKQMLADRAQGFDFVGYHAYARRRYFELPDVDIDAVCSGIPEPFNTTCSWRGFDESKRNVSSWFDGCACWMAKHPSGP